MGTMKTWRLLPRDDVRSENGHRSLYDGNHGAVIVRATTTFEARKLAAEFFEHPACAATLENPWLEETDTMVEELANSEFPAEGEAGVLQPSFRMNGQGH
jgi:hypothetical protein